MFTGLRHGTVGSGHHQDTTVHLGSTGDHVLDVVGVAGAVHVSVVALVGFVFDVGGGDGDATFLFFRSLVDFVVGDKLAFALQTGNLGDGGGQRGLAVVDVTDGADVHMGLRAGVFFLAHCTSPWRKFFAFKYLIPERRPKGIRPQNPWLPGNVLDGIRAGGKRRKMERETGFEPATLSLEG